MSRIAPATSRVKSVGGRSRPDPNTHLIARVAVLTETELAIRVSATGMAADAVWLPFSQIFVVYQPIDSDRDSEMDFLVIMPRWLAMKKDEELRQRGRPSWLLQLTDEESSEALDPDRDALTWLLAKAKRERDYA